MLLKANQSFTISWFIIILDFLKNLICSFVFFSIYRQFSTHACTSTQIARSIRWLDSLKMYDLQSIFLRNKGKIPSGCYILK